MDNDNRYEFFVKVRFVGRFVRYASNSDLDSEFQKIQIVGTVEETHENRYRLNGIEILIDIIAHIDLRRQWVLKRRRRRVTPLGFVTIKKAFEGTPSIQRKPTEYIPPIEMPVHVGLKLKKSRFDDFFMCLLLCTGDAPELKLSCVDRPLALHDPDIELEVAEYEIRCGRRYDN